MEVLKITPEQLANMENIGRGACANVYRYDTDLVIKVFNENGEKMHNEEQFSKLVGIENPTVVFPKKRVKIGETSNGYIMDYVPGVNLSEIIEKIDIDTLIKAIQKVENDLKALAKEKILFDDFNHGGVMWEEENKRIKITDTDFFIKNENIAEQECENENIKEFNSLIEMELGILNGQGKALTIYLHSNPQFYELYERYMIGSFMGNNISVTELIEMAVKICEQDFGVEINNFEEMANIIKARTGITDNVMTEDVPTFVPPDGEAMEIHDIIEFFNVASNERIGELNGIEEETVQGIEELDTSNKDKAVKGYEDE